MGFARNSIMVSSARIVEKIFAFSVILIASRRYGNNGVGEFFYYFSLASMFLPLMNLGLGKVMLQDWWDRPEPSRRSLMTHVLVLKLLLGAVSVTAVLGVDAVARWGRTNPLAVFAAFCAVFAEGLGTLFRVPAQARENFVVETFVAPFSRLLTLAFLLFFSGSIHSGWQIAFCYAAANIAGCIVSIIPMRWCVPAWGKGLSCNTFVYLVKKGAPFSMTSLFVMISFYIDSVMLGHYSFAQVGDYNAAYRVIVVAALLSGAGCQALFPKLVRFAREKRYVETSWFFNRTFRIYIMVFGVFMLGGIAVGKELIPTLFGSEFNKSGYVFMLLCPLILLSALTNVCGHTLEALGFQKKVMRINMVSAGFNVVANFIFIPWLGMYGAALTTIMTESLTLVQNILILRTMEQLPKGFEDLKNSFIFVGVVAVLYIPLYFMPLFGALPVGAVLFAVFSLAAKKLWPDAVQKIFGRFYTQTGTA